MTALGQLFGQHVPRNRYDDEGAPVGTYCVCGGWEGDYFADGEAGPFDEHLAAVVGEWIGNTAEARALALVTDLLIESASPGGPVGYWKCATWAIRDWWHFHTRLIEAVDASEDVRTAPLADSGDLNHQLSTTDSGEAARGTE